MKEFTEQMRYEYPLTKESLVLDIGAHEGKFSAEISRRYGCSILAFEPVKEFYDKARATLAPFPDVVLYPHGVGPHSTKLTFGVKGDMTGAFTNGNRTEEVSILGVSTVVRDSVYDLVKINIEGAEYDLLDYVLDMGLHTQFKNIQVQFHGNVPDCEKRWKSINERLLKTHRLTYYAPFCWENYELI